MSLVDAHRNRLGGIPEKREPAVEDPGWSAPTFEGRPIYEQLARVGQFKRSHADEEALRVAQGCMAAMREAALRDPGSAMEVYVAEVALLQHKLGRFADEARTIESWLDLRIPAPRADVRVNLEKRLAKARELVARAEGLDPSPHRALWRVKLAEEKALKKSGQVARGDLTGRSRAAATRPRQRAAVYIPTREALNRDEFVAVDFETANRVSQASACQVALIKVKSGSVVDSLVTYLRPPEEYSRFEFTDIHGIEFADVAAAPTWYDIADHVHEFVADLPVYAHNASFDARVWRALDAHFFTGTFPREFYCTCRTARRLLPHLPNHTLPTVTAYCAPAFRLVHHTADSDALACAHIVSMFQRTPSLNRLLG
ncbi:DNA polymerase III subunit epsilon [Corynebacterium capitovis DSM 44611]|uniref:exonuclease domain-containing protein n=1 Tax=Corynebacterium capitovis TaxID=131081 RepID=UPI00037769F3|nr:exonuclease domain-containing protein [Corynebacterium capitovis]WKD58014.1 DNA polymerase III subunit epsilon [Corynebacterium capitovis DSM 44611]